MTISRISLYDLINDLASPNLLFRLFQYFQLNFQTFCVNNLRQLFQFPIYNERKSTERRLLWNGSKIHHLPRSNNQLHFYHRAIQDPLQMSIFKILNNLQTIIILYYCFHVQYPSSSSRSRSVMNKSKLFISCINYFNISKSL